LEGDVSEGLEPVAVQEIRERLGKQAHVLGEARQAGVIQFSYTGDLRTLLKLQTVQAIFLVQRFAVPRPKALLGDEHFRKLLAQVEAVRSLFPTGTFKTLYLSAAGSDSSVMTRLKAELAQRTRLAVAEDEGDLLIRVRPAPGVGVTPAPHGESSSWEVLVRMSPRPLATRPWRVCNFEGALNAAVAHAVVRLTRPDPQDVYVNLACGSGTLLVERLAYGGVRQAIGCDIDSQALVCAQANLDASGRADHAHLCRADARALPFPDRSVDALTADLPFGHLVGSHAENVAAYPRILQEAARVARSGARFGLITHEVRLMEQLLASAPDTWAVEDVLRVELGGLHPRIFVLRKR
jgi:23S rRNA G2445 N2-methylase RlmL